MAAHARKRLTGPGASRRGPGARAAALGIAFLGALACSRSADDAASTSEFRALDAAEPVAESAKEPAHAPVRYDRDVRPILADRCFRCHGPDGAKRKADLRLDVAESAYAEREDGPAIVPGDARAGQLVHRVASEDPEERMPPPSSNKRPLSSEERELLGRWIADGAQYEKHWSFVPPVRPEVPQVASETWCRGPIDHFVAAQLEREGVAPGPEADRETLLRRVFLDLTGLPPTPEELDLFLADTAPDAYERQVERLLTEEPYRTRYAERLAVPWLDAARYADTCGIHTDAGRQIWPWRDWLLAALRDGMPFDRFVIEQLAGDLLPGATESQKVASGFNRNHVTSDEGGAIPEEYLVEYAVERTATTGSVFLGLTLGCARCHEHKFDPISQEEFYSFYSFFDSIEEPGLYSQLPDPKRAFEPFMAVPSEAQKAEKTRLEAQLAEERVRLDTPAPDEAAQSAAFFADLRVTSGLAWPDSHVVDARSSAGATLTIQPDGSVLAGGTNPDKDEHVLTLRTDATGLRLVLVEALTDPSLAGGRVGRAPNGNAVLAGVRVEAVSVADPARREDVKLVWAWADHEQDNGDFGVVNVLDTSDALGWALDSHRKEGSRAALLLADRPFGFEGGTDVVVHLEYGSMYAQHVIGRPRVSVGGLGEAGLELLPAAASYWALVGPFPADSPAAAYTTAFGPESDAVLDFARNFGAGNQTWTHVDGLADGKLNLDLTKGQNATYVGRRLFAPTARKLVASLGSDDGFRLFVDAKEVAGKQIDRSLAADQDQVELDLGAGAHALVFKVVNSGGDAGFYWKTKPRVGELSGDLVASLLPDAARTPELASRMDRAWRVAFSPGYRERIESVSAIERRLAALDAETPRTMVMKELAMARPTFVLQRGQYDHPDKERPVKRGVPAALGKLPEGAPADRLGLAQWLVSAENPLLSRVTVNRFWEMFFGTGIVRTSEDFGLQGEWPSHPELLDWLAVDFREGGWDVHALVRAIVESSTYRQSSRVRPDVRERDPDDRWLAWFPRQRLPAESIRDQALYVSGLLVERLGGPSVKTYQPEGLWPEVAMPASNTRIFERGTGDDLWRRSLYTYWKRACPPPSLMTFDAPTREFCTIRRPTTNTPLQALVLWNDEQFVEAARVLAERTLGEPGDDRARLVRLFRRCASRTPDESEIASLAAALEGFRTRYRGALDEAKAIAGVGTAMAPATLDPAELAAWTLISSAVLNLDATICRG